MRTLPVVLMLALAACSSGQAAPEWAGTVETLPNGVVRVSNPAQGMWTEWTAWRLVPELVIGELEGREEYTFATLMGLEVDDAGRMYVVDRQVNQLRIFDSDGAHLRTVGRTGDGPGEYQNANGIAWLSPDTLVVVDQRAGRYSILTRDGDFIRSVPRRVGFFGWAFSGAVADGKVYEYFSVEDESDGRKPILLRTELRSAAAEDADTVRLPVPAGPPPEAFTVRSSTGGMVISAPFSPRAHPHLDPSGGYWYAHGSDFRVLHARLGGEVTREILLVAEPQPVAQAEREEWLAGETATMFRERGGRIDPDRIPRTRPLLDGLYVDPDGHLWVSIPASRDQVVFAVFDPEGRHLGHLRLDGVRRTAWIEPRVRNGRLYLVCQDDLDVQRIYVFRIERGPDRALLEDVSLRYAALGGVHPA